MITGIGHIAFNISNLEKSLDFYCGKLGFREAFRLDREGTPSPWIVYIQVTRGNFIELFPGLPEEAANHTTHYNHFCLLVDDMQQTLHDLAAHGLSINGEPQQGMDSNWQYWLTDPDGNRIELMQINPQSPQAQADNNVGA